MYNQYIGTDYVSIEYFLGRSQNHIILILHFIDGIPISPFQCQASLVSGRQRSGCGCPPSFARSRKRGERRFGILLTGCHISDSLFFARKAMSIPSSKTSILSIYYQELVWTRTLNLVWRIVYETENKNNILSLFCTGDFYVISMYIYVTYD